MIPLYTLLASGMKGEPMPYLLRSDWMITGILFLCIIVISYIVSKGKKHLQQQLKFIFTTRERASLFDDATGSDIRYTFALIVNACIMLGICAYYYVVHYTPQLLEMGSHFVLLGLFVILSIFYVIAKWGIYKTINWIFFEKSRNLSWTPSYFNIIVWLGLVLLPVISLMVYFDLTTQSSFIFMALAIISAKILLLWKCFNNFFGKIHGIFHLILYFCTLEILPDLILWKGILISCNKLILNI